MNESAHYQNADIIADNLFADTQDKSLPFPHSSAFPNTGRNFLHFLPRATIQETIACVLSTDHREKNSVAPLRLKGIAGNLFLWLRHLSFWRPMQAW